MGLGLTVRWQCGWVNSALQCLGLGFDLSQRHPPGLAYFGIKLRLAHSEAGLAVPGLPNKEIITTG